MHRDSTEEKVDGVHSSHLPWAYTQDDLQYHQSDRLLDPTPEGSSDQASRSAGTTALNYQPHPASDVMRAEASTSSERDMGLQTRLSELSERDSADHSENRGLRSHPIYTDVVPHISDDQFMDVVPPRASMNPGSAIIHTPSEDWEQHGRSRSSRVVSRDYPNFKPRVLRPRFLLFLLLGVLFLAMLAVIAMRVLPDGTEAVVPTYAMNGNVTKRGQGLGGARLGWSDGSSTDRGSGRPTELLLAFPESSQTIGHTLSTSASSVTTDVQSSSSSISTGSTTTVTSISTKEGHLVVIHPPPESMTAQTNTVTLPTEKAMAGTKSITNNGDQTSTATGSQKVSQTADNFPLDMILLNSATNGGSSTSSGSYITSTPGTRASEDQPTVSSLSSPTIITPLAATGNDRVTSRPSIHTSSSNASLPVSTIKTSGSNSAHDGFLTEILSTRTDHIGLATSTETIIAYISVKYTTLVDSSGHPTSTKELEVLTYDAHTSVLTGSGGLGLSTQTYFFLPEETTLSDAQGKPTATRTSFVTDILLVSKLIDSKGSVTGTTSLLVPAPKPTSNTTTTSSSSSASSFPSSSSSTQISNSTQGPAPENVTQSLEDTVLTTYSTSNGAYFTGLFLPSLAATLLSIPIHILDQTAKLYQPFHALATTGDGASAAESLCFSTAGNSIIGLFMPRGSGWHILPFLTGLLTLVGALLVPLSTVVVRIVPQGNGCLGGGSSDGLVGSASSDCGLILAVFPKLAVASIALLVFMGLLVIITAILALRYRTGVRARPWTLNEMTELSISSDLGFAKDPLSGATDTKALASRTYGLDHWTDDEGMLNYGIVSIEETVVHRAMGWTHRGYSSKKDRIQAAARKTVPFFVLTTPGRMWSLAFLCGVLSLILVYDNTDGSTGFESFMDNQSMCVRFLFTVIGVVISLFWSTYFNCKSHLYSQQARHHSIPR